VNGRRGRAPAPVTLASIGLAVILAVAACAGPNLSPAVSSDVSPTPPATSPSAATPPSSPSASLSRDDAWRFAITTLVEEHERIHPDPYHGIDRETYRAAADELGGRIPALDDNAALAGLVRLAAMPGWNGRDGHTGIFPFIPGSGTHEYPLRFWRFSDGLVITAARAPYERLVGSRVTAIAGRPIDDVLARIEPLAPRDNPSNLLAYGPLYLRVSELLAGVGVLDRPGPAAFSLVDRAGKPSEETIEPIPAEDDVAWNSGEPHRLPPRDVLWLHDQATPIWWRYLDDSKTLYLQYNEVEATASVADEILARVKAGGVDRVVVDLRNNGGGDNRRYVRLLAALQNPAIDRPGRLFVLFGRVTFSAAANFATEVEQTTGARFVGEAMGGSPNQYGDVRATSLGPIGQEAYIATIYWQKSTADDSRITIDPDITVPFSSDDYFGDRDPTLAAAIGAAAGSR
jgi:hypothetical protein